MSGLDKPSSSRAHLDSDMWKSYRRRILPLGLIARDGTMKLTTQKPKWVTTKLGGWRYGGLLHIGVPEGPQRCGGSIIRPSRGML